MARLTRLIALLISFPAFAQQLRRADPIVPQPPPTTIVVQPAPVVVREAPAPQITVQPAPVVVQSAQVNLPAWPQPLPPAEPPVGTLERYQTLFAALIALGAAVLTAIVLRGQTKAMINGRKQDIDDRRKQVAVIIYAELVMIRRRVRRVHNRIQKPIISARVAILRALPPLQQRATITDVVLIQQFESIPTEVYRQNINNIGLLGPGIAKEIVFSYENSSRRDIDNAGRLTNEGMIRRIKHLKSDNNDLEIKLKKLIDDLVPIADIPKRQVDEDDEEE